MLFGVLIGSGSSSDGSFVVRKCQPDLLCFQDLCDTANEQLFDKIQQNEYHLLHYLFLPPSAASHATISAEVHILSCFRNTRDTLWTLTSLLEYYTKTFTDAIM